MYYKLRFPHFLASSSSSLRMSCSVGDGAKDIIAAEHRRAPELATWASQMQVAGLQHVPNISALPPPPTSSSESGGSSGPASLYASSPVAGQMALH